MSEQALSRRALMFGGLAAVGAAPAVAEAVSGQSRLTVGGLIDMFGQEAVLSTMADLLTPVDLREVRRILNRPRQQQRRAAKRRRNAERHRDMIVWRGLLNVSGVIDELTVLPADIDFDGQNQRHGGRARRGIRKARLPWPVEVTEYDTGLQLVHEVLAGSRLVMDCRRTLGPVCTAEIVQVVGREMRLHLWSRAGEQYPETATKLTRLATIGGLFG
jgi:hypothetical protein